MPSLLAISVTRPGTLRFRGRGLRSSINKENIPGPVMVRRLNIDGDEQADLRVHGGQDKAVYVYPAEHYGLWHAELGRELPFGSFGENLTVAGLLEDSVRVGDVLAVGGAVLQVTGPRFPCFKLGIKFGDQHFLRRFQKSERSGFYCRVLEEGAIEVGLEITVLETDPHARTIASIVGLRNRIAELYVSSPAEKASSR